MALVSVIIPCFNAGRWVAEAVESALLQKKTNEIEVIVVDDGSTDDSRAKISAFGDRVTSIFSAHAGASAARERGTATARGEFIQYLDADDRLRPDAVARRVKALTENGADVAYSDWQVLAKRGGKFALQEVHSITLEHVHMDPEIAIFTGFWAPPAAILYRRSIVEKIGRWHSSLPVIQDARFLLDAALHGAKFIHVAGIGAEYRVEGHDSLSRRDSAGFVRDMLLNTLEIKGWWESRGGLTSTRKSALVKVLETVARSAFEKDRRIFEEAYRHLEALRPGYIPETSWRLAAASRVVGYRNAERLALWWRKMRRSA